MFFLGTMLSLRFDFSFIHFLILFTGLVLMPLSFCYVTRLAKNKQVWILFFIPAFLFAGILSCELHTDEKLRPLYPFSEQEVEIYGAVSGVPVVYDNTKQFFVEVSRIKTDDGVFHVKEKIKVSTELCPINAGDSIQAYGKLKVIDYPKNSTSFNSKRYNMRRGIFFSLYAEDINQSPEAFPISLKSRITIFINSTLNSYINQFPVKTTAFIKAIILNNKSEIPDEITESMVRTGLYRYIYCPYIHISLIVLILSYIVKTHRRRWLTSALIFSLYLIMNFSVAAAWKICLYYIISHIMMRLFGIKDFKTTIYLTVITAGFINPLVLTEPAFMISLLCTALIRVFHYPVADFLRKKLRNKFVASFLSTFLIISIGIYPFCSFLGFNMTPWSFVLSLVMTPLIILTYFIFYMGFTIFLISGHAVTLGIPYIVKVIIFIVENAEKLPFASINTKNPGLLYLAAFYSVLYCLYHVVHFRRHKYAEILSLLLCFIFTVTYTFSAGNMEMTFLSVGNADCCVIELPFNKTVMIDGGGAPPYSDYDIGSAEVIPYLRAKGVNKVDTIIVSHYDKDHTDGIITVIKTMAVGEIFMPDYLPKNDYRDIIISEAENNNIKINLISSPAVFDLGSGLGCEFLLSQNTDNENDNSLVARLTYGKTRILFPGDITIFAEDKLQDIQSDIVKVPHHGSLSSSSESFISKTDADYCIFSVGKNNTYGHPNPKVVERYKRSGSKIFRTDLMGDIHFIIGKNSIKRVYTYRE